MRREFYIHIVFSAREKGSVMQVVTFLGTEENN